MQQQTFPDNQQDLRQQFISMGFDQQKVDEILKITKAKKEAIELLLQSKAQKIDEQGSFSDQEEDYKMIFVVRMDLKLQLGKIAELVGTAALKAYRQMEAYVDVDQLKEYAFFQWCQSGQKKIVVKSPSEIQLLQLLEKAKIKGINFSAIYEKPSKLQIQNNNEQKQGKGKKNNKLRHKQGKQQVKQQVKQQSKQVKQQTVKEQVIIEEKQILVLAAFGPAAQTQIDPLTKMFKLL